MGVAQAPVHVGHLIGQGLDGLVQVVVGGGAGAVTSQGGGIGTPPAFGLSR